jgi:hypothetical protein
MAEQKKKRNPLLDRFKKDMNTKEDLAKLQEKAKQETLAASKNKKLSEPAKQKLKVQKKSDEDQRASAAMKRSRETINALANRGTLKSYGGYSGPAETENKVTNPAKPPASKPKPKPQATAPKPKPKPQAAAPTPKPKPEAKPQMSSLFDRRKMTSATSNLFIGPRAAAAQRGYREEDRPKRRRRGQGSRR